MNKREFDDLIRQNCTALSFRPEPYRNYLDDAAFAEFLNDIPAAFRQKYREGRGKETEPRGKMPPKMASIASSSRFCAIALQNGAGALGGEGTVEVEVACPIRGVKGTPPQLDARSAPNLFIEVKCHEIFDAHSVRLKAAYWEHLFGEGNDFGFPPRQGSGEREFTLPLSAFDLPAKTSRLDVKQLLCHLLGVRSQKGEGVATLVYLFFKPKSPAVDGVFDELQAELRTVFESAPIQNFIQKNNIRLRAVAEYATEMVPLTAENLLELYPTPALEGMAPFFEARLEGYDAHMLEAIEGAGEFYPFTAACLPAEPGCRILDLGCGTGLELEAYFRLNPRAQVTGIDLSRGMLDALRSKFPGRALELLEGSYFELPLGEGYDAAVSVESLHHFTPQEKLGLYKRVKQALKPGGFFVLTDYFAPSAAEEELYRHTLACLKREQGLADGEFYHYDTPLTVEYETRALEAAGFAVEVLKNWGATYTLNAKA